MLLYFLQKKKETKVAKKIIKMLRTKTSDFNKVANLTWQGVLFCEITIRKIVLLKPLLLFI